MRAKSSARAYGRHGTAGLLRCRERAQNWNTPCRRETVSLSDRELRGATTEMAVSMVRNVFVYGSLLAPEVLTALLDRIPASAPAVVHDFHRFSIKDRVYPAVLPAQGSEVTGKVLFDLTDKELEVLDEFEDVDYIKQTVEPSLLDTKGLNISIASPLKANMYVWSNSQDKDLYGDWDYENWRTEQLEEYTKMCVRFMDYLGNQ